MYLPTFFSFRCSATSADGTQSKRREIRKINKRLKLAKDFTKSQGPGTTSPRSFKLAMTRTLTKKKFKFEALMYFNVD